jgi:hypothetical protein
MNENRNDSGQFTPETEPLAGQAGLEAEAGFTSLEALEKGSDPDSTGRKQADTRFQPGKSGNPNGRPKGSRNATTLALETLLDGQATALTQKSIDIALAGDMAALRLCLDRILPPRKDRPVTFTLPEIKSAKDAASVVSAILAAVASGELTPTDAAEIGKLIDSYVKAFETAELAERLEHLERVTHR